MNHCASPPWSLYGAVTLRLLLTNPTTKTAATSCFINKGKIKDTKRQSRRWGSEGIMGDCPGPTLGKDGRKDQSYYQQ